MNSYPEFVKIGDKKYKINTDFRIALKCNEITADESIGDNERGLAMIYLLFGDEGLNDEENHSELLYLANKYLLFGKDYNEIETSNEEPDMDFIQDMDYIEASFMSDYNIDLSSTKMHWWKFYKLINGLSNSEMGNCCILNRIRNIRTMDLNEISDRKKREQFAKAKQQVALVKKERTFTDEEKASIDKFNKMAGI